jgi:DNA-binding NtrC family response regulator
MPEHIVLAEDDRELRGYLAEVLEGAGYTVSAFETADAALDAIPRIEPDLIVTDLIMPGMRGHELLQHVRQLRPELNVVIITAFGTIDSAIELVKAGAYDYLPKPFSDDDLLLTVRRALEESRLKREVARLSRENGAPPAGFIGASRALQELFRTIRRAAASELPALITGESGVGKELVARALHGAAGRREFIALNCAAIPENLLESELFGHEKGAFTGADREKIGLFEAAHGGTLFLDEIAELPPPLQPKLLRVLESGEVRRVGSTRTRTFDVRLVAATHRDLEAEVREGRFREDLFWRLNVLHIHVPPLRERIADIPLLAEHFAARLELAHDAMALLTSYPWPGNVRELRNAIESASTMAEGDSLRACDLPARIREHGASAPILADAARTQPPLRDLERAYILEILRQTAGNKSRAAEILGLDRKTLYRKLDEFRVGGLDS